MQLFHQIYTLKKVVIAQVQGHALAGGCGLAAICDFAFAVPEAKFGYTEVKIGFLPAIVSVFLLRKIGEARTKQLLLSGDVISAQTALDMGLGQFPGFQGRAGRNTCARMPAACARKFGPEHGSDQRNAGPHSRNGLWRTACATPPRRNAEARGSDDCRQGIAAFLSKEKISW